MRLGIFGGSFDPVHLGHLLLADCCCDQASLDEVWFIPTAQQPLKPTGPWASDQDRLAMLQRACADQKKFRVSTRELERGGVSYSVDTLASIQAEVPDAELFFLMGADSLADFPMWHRPADICELATLVVVRRAATAEPDFNVLRPLVTAERLERIRRHQVEMPPTPISSSLIRDTVRDNGVWQHWVPTSVASYIAKNQLYSRNS